MPSTMMCTVVVSRAIFPMSELQLPMPMKHVAMVSIPFNELINSMPQTAKRAYAKTFLDTDFVDHAGMYVVFMPGLLNTDTNPRWIAKVFVNDTSSELATVWIHENPVGVTFTDKRVFTDDDNAKWKDWESCLTR